MYTLSEHEFYVGAGLVALMDNNANMLPTWINTSSSNNEHMGKKRRGKGAFYLLETKDGKRFVVYIKYTEDLKKNAQMQDDHMWSFNLSSIEKRKIQEQYEKVDTLFILLICKKNDRINQKLDSQVILLTWGDYCEISQRSTIQVGIMKSRSNNKSKQHYYSFKIGKGVKGLENYYEVKRNKIEKMLDEYAFENCEEDVEVVCQREIKDDKREIIYVKDNVGWCAACKTGTLKKTLQSKNAGHIFKFHECPKCQKKYMDIGDYYDAKESEIDSEQYEFLLLRNVVSKVFVTNENKSVCEQCGDDLVVMDVMLKIYENMQKNNNVVKREQEDLFYCKACKRYYVTPPVRKRLEDKYGKYRINFKE